jgi:hypothetical protein
MVTRKYLTLIFGKIAQIGSYDREPSGGAYQRVLRREALDFSKPLKSAKNRIN